MIGFILAAGFGTRLRPLTAHLPKALVPIGGAPLLSRSLAYLQRQNITTIGVNSHYLHDQMLDFRRSSRVPFELFHERDSIRGTGGAFDFAREFLSRGQTFFVLNVDILTSLDLQPLIGAFEKSDWSGALLAQINTTGNGTVLYDRTTKRYLGLSAERGRFPDASSADFIGAAMYRKSFLDLVTPGDFAVTDIWKRAQQGKHSPVGIIEITAGCYWRDTGSPRSLAEAHFDIIDGALNLDIPDELFIDRAHRRCIPKTLDPGKYAIGSCTWIESADIPRDCSISRSVVFAGGRISGNEPIHCSLVTPWGDIHFNDNH